MTPSSGDSVDEWIAKLEQLQAITMELESRKTNRPIEQTAWLPLQYRFLASAAKIREIRAGNQGIGKTRPALSEVIGRATGIHPLAHLPPWMWEIRPDPNPDHNPTPTGPYSYPPPREGWEGWIVCGTWGQSLAVQEKLWHLLPKDLLDPRTKWDKAQGFSPTKSPVVRFKNGSIIRIKTAEQDELTFASATIDLVLFDEPPASARMFTEALQRLEELSGYLLLSYTPINRDTTYLQELVAAERLIDFHSRLTVESLIPVGHTQCLVTLAGEPKDAEYIKRREESVPRAESPDVVIHGEWDSGEEGAYFADAWLSSMVTPNYKPEVGQIQILGIDWGHRPGKQCCHLIILKEGPHGDDPDIYVLDEYVDETGTAGPREDALGLLGRPGLPGFDAEEMELGLLPRNGLEWGDLNHARSDRDHMQGTGFAKGALDLTAAIVRLLNLRTLKPDIRVARKGKNSVKIGKRWLHLAMRQGRFRVHPRCVRLIEAIPRWDGRELDSEYKDPIDDLRYALEPWSFRMPKRTAGASPRLAVR